MPQNSFSAFVVGFWLSLERYSSGVGRFLRSSLPLGVKGISSSCIYAVGTM